MYILRRATATRQVTLSFELRVACVRGTQKSELESRKCGGTNTASLIHHDHFHLDSIASYCATSITQPRCRLPPYSTSTTFARPQQTPFTTHSSSPAALVRVAFLVSTSNSITTLSSPQLLQPTLTQTDVRHHASRAHHSSSRPVRVRTSTHLDLAHLVWISCQADSSPLFSHDFSCFDATVTRSDRTSGNISAANMVSQRMVHWKNTRQRSRVEIAKMSSSTRPTTSTIFQELSS